MVKRTRRSLKEDLFNVEKVNFIGTEYYDKKSPLLVDNPSDLIRSLEGEIESEPTGTLEKKLGELTKERIGDIGELVHEGYAKTFLFYKDIFVLKKPSFKGEVPIAYPYNIDKKRALCLLLASRSLDRYLIHEYLTSDGKPLVRKLIQGVLDYLESKRKRDENPLIDHRVGVGTGLNYENQKRGRAFLRSYQTLRERVIREKNNFERFILMLSLSALYTDIMYTFGREGLKEQGIIENIKPINSKEDINGELKYWSGSYFHSRFAQEGKFWQNVIKKQK